MGLRQQLQQKGIRMSSQQWLYPIFRFQGYRVTKVETDEHRLLLHVEPQPHRVCCPQCESRDRAPPRSGGRRRGQQVRWLRNLPVGPDCTWLIATLPRVECRSCRKKAHRRVTKPARVAQKPAVSNTAICCLCDSPTRCATVSRPSHRPRSAATSRRAPTLPQWSTVDED